MTNFIIRSITFLLALSLPIVAFVWFQTPGMWVGKDGSKQDGFSFNPGNGTTPSLNWQYFNFHPFLMILGFGFFGTSAVTTFKLIPMSHTTQKFIHAGLHIIAIAFTSGSLLVIMTFKEVTENQEFFSPHAWLGIASLGGYDLNALLAFLLFIIGRYAAPSRTETLREMVVPVHRYFGFVIYAACFATMISGITGRLWLRAYPPGDALYSMGDYLVILIFATLSCSVFVLYHLKQAKPRDDYDMVPTDNDAYGVYDK